MQGATEFLPVSSSGHLILLSKLTAFPDQGLEMDIAVHLGSIAAVLLYFIRDIYQMAKGLALWVLRRAAANAEARLFGLLIVGTLPAVIFGLILHSYGMEWLRDTRIIGWNILCFGLLLGWADRHFAAVRNLEQMRVKDALLIGLAQCLALIPGTSRSGITITASRMLKIKRREAAKFCMLLSIPAIAGAALLVIWELFQNGDFAHLSDLGCGAAYSFVASMLAIFVMMNWLKNYTFLPFVVYRVLLGSLLLLHAYGVF